MSDTGNAADDLARVVGAGVPQTVGSFSFRFADQRWEWSPEVAAMHGYDPSVPVVPTTELLLGHKHPDDRAHVADAIAHTVASSVPFCSRHRIVDTAGRVHPVLVIGDRLRAADDTVIGTTGYYIDLTDTVDESRREVLDETLPELIEARAVIEQAKGVLMRMYRINADQAFRVLRWRSQDTNLKLRVLAERLLAEIATLPPDPPGVQTAFDHLILNLHERPTV